MAKPGLKFAGVLLLLGGPARASSETVIYSFAGGNDGSGPCAGLYAMGGKLYGTTSSGGTGCGVGCGTVFSVTPAGKEHVVYSFKGKHDGDNPIGRLIGFKGALYGTTQEGAGTGCLHGCGTVFKLTPSGVETTLHSFGDGLHGGMPAGTLVLADGNFYGTTPQGGSHAEGVIFKLTPDGTYSVVHAFRSPHGGYEPLGDLLFKGGMLYGTTFSGGGTADGTVFRMTLNGSETVLHSFTGSPDGLAPFAGPLDVGGTLYGTTTAGGNTGCGGIGCGTVYSVAKDGSGHVVYAFAGGNKGSYSVSELIEFNGELYGTTVGDAAHGGTVFKVTPGGSATILHVFTGGSDGFAPVGRLLRVGSALYGTTTEGGATNNGTVYKLVP